MRKQIIAILDHLMDTLDEAIFLKDGEGRWLYVNQQAISLFDLQETAWENKTDLELSELKPLFRREFLKCIKDDILTWELGTTIHFEESVLTNDGEELIFDVQKVPLFRQDGSKEALYTIARNVSAQRLAERQLQNNEAHYKSLFNNAPFPYQSLDMDSRILDVNQAWCHWLGYTKDQVIGHFMGEFLSSESVERLGELFPRFVAMGEVNNLDMVLLHQSGKPIRALVSGRIDLNIPEPLRHTHCIFIDETIKDEQNQILRREQNYLRFLIDSIGVSIYGVDSDGVCSFINPAGIKTLGYTNASEIIGKGMHELIHHSRADGSYFPRSECKFHQAYQKGEFYHSEEETFWRKNHTPFNVEFWSHPLIENGNVIGAVTTFVDISERLIARAQLIESEKRFRIMFDQAPLPYQSLNSEGIILDINQAWLDHFGYERSEVVRHSYQEFITPESLATLYKNFPNLVAYGAVNNVEFDIVCKDKSIRHIELEGRTSLDSHGNFLHTHCILSDITEKTRYINDLKLSSRIIQGAAEGIMITDSNRTILSVNPAFHFLTGYSSEEVIGKQPSILKSGRHKKEYYQAMNAILDQGETWQGEIWNRKKSGEIYAEFLSINPVFDDNNCITHYVAIFADITEQKKSQEKLHYIAHHDVLTTLPNRIVLFENLSQAIAIVQRDKKFVALLMLDLDRFKDINDNYGHPSGDELLKKVALDLKSRLRSTDLIARLGGDEFAVLLRSITHPQDAAEVANDLIAAVSKSYVLESGIEVFVGLTIGIAIAPEHGKTSEELMQHADIALYSAKAFSKGNFHFYTDEMTEQARKRFDIEIRLRKAVSENQLYLHYQPQVDISTGHVVSVEALVRWNDPDLGIVPPSIFIPIAEECGLIKEIGLFVLETGCKQAKEWLDGGVEIRVAINLSSRQFEEGNIHKIVFKSLQRNALPSHLLELELTESIVLHNEEKIMVQLNALKQHGVTLALDDFGTGYSSLSYLKQLPFDILKIDKSFIDGIPNVKEDMQIASSIIAMGHILGFKVLAEGVETHEQLIFLQAKGCDTYQGYFKSRPVDENEIMKLMSSK